MSQNRMEERHKVIKKKKLEENNSSSLSSSSDFDEESRHSLLVESESSCNKVSNYNNLVRHMIIMNYFMPFMSYTLNLKN